MIDSQLIQWGIVGPGRIASQVVRDFPYAGGRPASPPVTRPSRGLRREHGLERAYGSYAEIMAAPDSMWSTSPLRIRSTTQSR